MRKTYTLYVETDEGNFEYARELTKTELMNEIRGLINSLYDGETVRFEVECEEK